jgi:hypothetical protein
MDDERGVVQAQVNPEKPGARSGVRVTTPWWGLRSEYHAIRYLNGIRHTKDKNDEWYAFIIDNNSDPEEPITVR